MKYPNVEIKVLNVNVEEIVQKLKDIGAQEVFNADRVITHLDDGTGRLREKNFKLTEEAKLKLSIDTEEEHSTIKVFASRKEECLDMLAELGIHPISCVTARRISFEWEGVDFDLDQFPEIPPFLEIETGESQHTDEDILKMLNIVSNEQGPFNTPQIFKKYGIDYFIKFKC